MFRNRLFSTLLPTAPTLRAALARRDHGTGDGEDDGKLTEQQWEERKRAELSKRSIDQLVSKQIELERDLKKARDRAAPEGARVLTADEAREYEALTKLGTAKDLSKRLEDGDKAASTLAGRERGDLIRDVAEAAGYKPSVLGRLADQDGLSFELGAEVETDGKKSRPVTVKTADGKTAPLGDYATSHWGEFAASLSAGAQQQQQERRVLTGGASSGDRPAGDPLAAKRADTRYSI